MEKDAIHLSDWQRILFGDAPGIFMLEVFVRTVLIYLALIVIVRLLGKRMSGQLTQTEIAVMVTLGAIVSPAMQLPDRGLLASAMTLLIILFLFRNINLLGVRSYQIELLTHGKETLMVKDGVLQLDEIGKASISHQQILAALRNKSIYNMGEVSRVYLEASGDFSIYTRTDKKPGLSTLPQTDNEIHIVQQAIEDKMSCCNCGNTIQVQNRKTTDCPVCGQRSWDGAYL